MEFIKIEGQHLIVASDNKGYIYLMNINNKKGFKLKDQKGYTLVKL